MVAISSAESELYAAVKTSSEVLGLMSLMKDLGVHVAGSVLGDASACLGIIQRKGLGKVRHIDTSYLWVQERAARKEILYGKIWGKKNPADLMTKYLPAEVIREHLERLGGRFEEGRAKSAPQTVALLIAPKFWPSAAARHRRMTRDSNA